MSEVSIAAPDLSHLPYETRVGIAIEVTKGATWRPRAPEWANAYRADLLELAMSDGRIIAREFSGGWPVRYDGPDWPNDPAAWGPLMERELARWETGEFDGERQHRCWWLNADCVTLTPGPWAQTLPWAVCLAFLAKHGRTVDP